MACDEATAGTRDVLLVEGSQYFDDSFRVAARHPTDRCGRGRKIRVYQGVDSISLGLSPFNALLRLRNPKIIRASRTTRPPLPPPERPREWRSAFLLKSPPRDPKAKASPERVISDVAVEVILAVEILEELVQRLNAIPDRMKSILPRVVK